MDGGASAAAASYKRVRGRGQKAEGRWQDVGRRTKDAGRRVG